MSKAFTKEDDDAGFSLPGSSQSLPKGPFHLTYAGAAELSRRADAHAQTALARAEILPRVTGTPARAALGITVTVRHESGEERRFRLVSPEEHALLGHGCSVHSPLGRAILGASVGDLRELRAPKGNEELEILALDGDDERRDEPDESDARRGEAQRTAAREPERRGG